MSAGRARRSLADLQAEHAAERERKPPSRPAPRLESLPAAGAFLPPHRPLSDLARRA